MIGMTTWLKWQEGQVWHFWRHYQNQKTKSTFRIDVKNAQQGAPTQTSEAKTTKPKLTSKLNNKATNAKLESANYLATQTKQCD